MKLMRFIGAASVAGMLSLGLAGFAAADDVALDTTGPNSTQTVKIDNSSKVDTTNTNNVEIANVNVQSAKTGAVTAKDNTTVGELSSGNAENANDTSTAVTIGNDKSGGQGGSSGGSNPGGGQGQGGSSGGSAPSGGGSGGSVLGASTTGGFGAGTEAMLPVTGPVGFVDVSALRAAWHPQTATPATKAADNSRAFNLAVLTGATLLGLAGAIGSALRARRMERRA